MKVTQQKLEDFSKISGDFNPVHLNEEYASKTMFGSQIVYGVYQVMLCLDAVAKELKVPFFISSVKAEFKRALSVNQSFEIETDINDKKVTAYVKGESVLSKVVFSYENVPNVGFLSPIEDFETKPAVPNRETRFRWKESIRFHEKLCKLLFPHATQYVHTLNLGVLLTSTRIIGMKYPGLNSIFKSIDLKFSLQTGEYISCEGMPKESLFGECVVHVSAPFAEGQLCAFFRPEIVHQNTFEVLMNKNMHADFSRQRALIVGATRGIGLQCLRLLSLGGAQTMFTYYKPEQEADEIADDLKRHGFSSSGIYFDINHQDEETLEKIKAFAPTHLYYFATPKISSDVKTLNEERFQLFCHYYIFALHNLSHQLKTSGLKNIFTPSSIAITELPKDMVEYAFAKATMEYWGGVFEKQRFFVYMPRFPRIKTAQTQTLLPVDAADAEDILFPELVKFEKESHYD